MRPYFEWTGVLEDGTEINQFVREEETLFSEIENNKSSLLKFKICSNNGEYYEVNKTFR